MQILIVEDDVLLGAGLQAALNGAGFVAQWVTDGLAAHDLIKQDNFLALVLDITLPGMERGAAQALIDAAHKLCPYSNATRGNINVTLTLK